MTPAETVHAHHRRAVPSEVGYVDGSTVHIDETGREGTDHPPRVGRGLSLTDAPCHRIGPRPFYAGPVATDRDILEAASDRLLKAVERGTGTSFDADEVRVLGRLLQAISSAVLGTAAGREACAVCGRPEHPPQVVGSYPRHAYTRAILVPLATTPE